ncbi:MAG: MBL fold metallo-hydrolase [Propionivibrio sp.]|uniref:MBL fold metallo-hydrolase n=1 Tax=Propionivibrio sp. TaxID=2212460 RepID=UPI001A5B8B69|nr:MBL fold metallo-hydrolase [Propionivibrio sp.]MBL8413830.1 MBL fold metallo-hydrolase [Propionivibrio sp.]
MRKLIRYEHGIFAIDADYIRPQLAAIHLIVENGRAAFVDTGCNDSLPNVMAALDELGLVPGNVDYVIPTHIHLDHAGGAGVMMQTFPNAHLVVHPRGARHMADPTRLIEGAAAVYGQEEVRRLYGEVLPIDARRIIEATHGLNVDLAGRQLCCLDTPGHARHHIALVDKKTGHIFTGDIFGLSYRELDTDARQFIFPTTTPVQFDPVAMHASIDLLMSYQPDAIYLTHFSQIRDTAAKALELHRLVDAHVAIARREKNAGAERHARIREGLEQLLLNETSRFGCRLPVSGILEIFDGDLELNAQGLGVWVDTEK